MTAISKGCHYYLEKSKLGGKTKQSKTKRTILVLSQA
jgi:hypothetical protein